MKNISSTFIVLFCITSVLIFMSNSAGRGNVFGQAVTGAPGDSNLTCGSSNCHSSGPFDPTGTLTVTDSDGNEVNSFTGGDTYKVSLLVEATSGSPSEYGFQMVALDNNNDPTTNWSNLGSGIQSVSIGGRDYVEHSTPSSNNTFEVDWTAPASGTGDVTFYFAFNAANGNGGTSGDKGGIDNFTLSDNPTNINEAYFSNLNIYPNPVRDYLEIENGTTNYIVQDLTGKTIIQENNGTSNLDVSTLESGMYLITFLADSKRITRKFMKL